MKQEYVDLIKEIPWLRMYDGELDNDCWVEEVPCGWRDIALEAFKKIDEVLKKKPEERATYQLVQVKEKWGMLRIYDNSSNDEIQDLLLELENESWLHCIDCGAKSEWQTTGWICPYCTGCRDKILRRCADTMEFSPISGRGWVKTTVGEARKGGNDEENNG